MPTAIVEQMAIKLTLADTAAMGVVADTLSRRGRWYTRTDVIREALRLAVQHLASSDARRPAPVPQTSADAAGTPSPYTTDRLAAALAGHGVR